MDLIKGLENGFFHTYIEGDSRYRTKVFNDSFKEHVDKGKFIRDIQPAPRDARYKIDFYYKESYSESDSIPYPSLKYWEEFYNRIFKLLNIDETFNFTERLKNNKSEHTNGDFTIGYGDFNFTTFDDRIVQYSNYYFKYKGVVNTLDFKFKPELVDYSDSFWEKYKNEPTTYNGVEKLIHNIGYFIDYHQII